VERGRVSACAKAKALNKLQSESQVSKAGGLMCCRKKNEHSSGQIEFHCLTNVLSSQTNPKSKFMYLEDNVICEH